jgi:hypothetical protein
MQGNAAIIAGNIDALGIPKAKPIWIPLSNAAPELIAEEIAFALIQRRWAKDAAEYRELTANEFKRLVQSISRVAEANRRVAAYKTPAKPDFEAILADVAPLAERMQGWSELTYFVATIAEGAENQERALLLYHRLKLLENTRISAAWLDAKIKTLESRVTKLAPEIAKTALDKIRDAATYATEVLNDLFKLDLAVPEIALISDTIRNAYWDGSKINAPAACRTFLMSYITKPHGRLYKRVGLHSRTRGRRELSASRILTYSLR